MANLGLRLPARVNASEDLIEPMLLLLGPILVNICYTAGWIAENVYRNLFGMGGARLGPMLLAAGLAFSLSVVTLAFTSLLMFTFSR